MTPTRLYHLPGSRSTRVLWALEELGAPYQLTTLTREDRSSDAHRNRHPLGRVPVVEDDDGFLFESAAIVLALADRHDGLNYALGTRERELVYQWILFAVTEIEPWVVRARDLRESDPEGAAAAAERVRAAATVLDDALRGRDYLVGDRFTAADIIAGSILGFARNVGLIDRLAELARYLDAHDARPAHALATAPA